MAQALAGQPSIAQPPAALVQGWARVLKFRRRSTTRRARFRIAATPGRPAGPAEAPFPFATERGETKELFLVISREVFWELVPAIGIHYDFDEVDGWYFNGAVTRAFPIAEKFAADAGVSLGYSDGDQSEWNYGLNESGLADLQAAGRLSYFLDDHTTIRASVNGSTIIDEDLQDWFDLIDIAHNNLWASIGVNWGY